MGNTLALIAAITWGFSYAIGAKLVQVYPAYVLMLLHAVITLPLFGLLAFLPSGREAVGNLMQGKMWELLLAEALLCMVANFMIFTALGKGNPVIAALIETSYPIFIVVAAFLIFRENMLTLPVLIGGALITTGVVVMTVWK